MRLLISQPNWLCSFPAAKPLRNSKEITLCGLLASFGQTESSGADPLVCNPTPGRVWPRQRSASPFASQLPSRNLASFGQIDAPSKPKEKPPFADNWLRLVSRLPDQKKSRELQEIGFVWSNRGSGPSVGKSAAAARPSAQCRLVFAKLGIRHNLEGGPPGPRGTPSSRSSLEESGACHHRQVGQGAGCERGRPPHYLCRWRNWEN
jgi:hypothetical protein